MSRASFGGLTPYEQLQYEADNDDAVKKEILDEKRIGFYKLKHKLGSGNFSEVKLAVHLLTKDKVAVKILNNYKLDTKTRKLVTREMEITKRVCHPHTVRFYEEIERFDKQFIVMEYCAHGDLHAKVTSNGKIPEKDARPIYAQIISAVDYLHSVHIVHRDIKAENIYFATPRFIKVGDYGFSTFATKEDALSTFCGSPPYAAPELLKDQSYVGTLVDIWALGVLLYFMVTSVMPFRADNFPRLKSLVLAGQYNMPEFLTESCVNLLRGILKLSPKDRISIAQIKNSAWLDDQEFVISYDEVSSPHQVYNDNLDDEEEEESDKRQRKHRRRHRNRRSKEQEAARDAEVCSKMEELGISREKIERERGNVRSNVTGVYRLLMHRLEKQTFPQEIDVEDSYSTSANGTRHHQSQDESPSVKDGRAHSANPQSSTKKPQKSSTCIVL